MKTLFKSVFVICLATTLSSECGMFNRFALKSRPFFSNLGSRLFAPQRMQAQRSFFNQARSAHFSRPKSAWWSGTLFAGLFGTTANKAKDAAQQEQERLEKNAQKTVDDVMKDQNITQYLVSDAKTWNKVTPLIDHHVFKRCDLFTEHGPYQCAQLRKRTIEKVEDHRNNLFNASEQQKNQFLTEQAAQQLARQKLAQEQHAKSTQELTMSLYQKALIARYKDDNGAFHSISTAPETGVRKIIDDASREFVMCKNGAPEEETTMCSTAKSNVLKAIQSYRQSLKSI